MFSGKFHWAALCALTLAALAVAQPPEKFTNLKVLRTDISKAELDQVMRSFTLGMGLRCDDCHVRKDPTVPGGRGLDFASDEKESKRTARAMMQMVEAINRDYVAKLGKASPLRVECVTCHRGLKKPETLVAVLHEEISKNGAAAAVARYKDMRQKMSASGQYDFSEISLNQLAEALLKENDAKDAVAISELNAEVNPLSGWGYSMLAMSHQANGELAKAKTYYQKLIELNPRNNWAKEQLDKLQQQQANPNP